MMEKEKKDLTGYICPCCGSEINEGIKNPYYRAISGSLDSLYKLLHEIEQNQPYTSDTAYQICMVTDAISRIANNVRR